MIVDMHCDTMSVLLRKKRAGEAVSLLENELHLDIKKMRSADYLVQNFALFINKTNVDNPLEEALQMADLYYEELAKNKEFIAPIFHYSDIIKNQKDGKISALLTIEEGAVLKGNASYLRMLHKIGVRMITLTWNFPNELGHPNINMEKSTINERSLQQAFITPNTDNGLTPCGIEMLFEMEKIGIIPDVSHLSDAGFYDVCKHTRKPFVASHSNARSICCAARNLSDDMIYQIAQKGGVIGLNFCPDFLLNEGSSKRKNGTIESILLHAKHIVDKGGIECLALGSDFDGIEGHEELPNASHMPKLLKSLEEAGFSNTQLEKITHQNALRVYKECFL